MLNYGGRCEGAGQLFFFQRRVERDAKSKMQDEVLARERREARSNCGKVPWYAR